MSVYSSRFKISCGLEASLLGHSEESRKARGIMRHRRLQISAHDESSLSKLAGGSITGWITL